MKELTKRQKDVIFVLLDDGGWITTRMIADKVGAGYPGGIPTLLGNLHLAKMVERRCWDSHTQWRITELGKKAAEGIERPAPDKGKKIQVPTGNCDNLIVSLANVKSITIEFK